MAGTPFFLRPWDSDFFGVRIAQADLGAIAPIDVLARAREERVECLYLFASSGDLETINRALALGARLVDLRIEFAGNTRPSDLGGQTRNATSADRDALVAMARTLEIESRFANDARFPLERVEATYETWLDKCLEHGSVAVPRDELAAFVGATPENGRTRIELAYVDKAQRGRGVALMLFRHVVAEIGPGVRGVAVAGQVAAVDRLADVFRLRSNDVRTVERGSSAAAAPSDGIPPVGYLRPSTPRSVRSARSERDFRGPRSARRGRLLMAIPKSVRRAGRLGKRAAGSPIVVLGSGFARIGRALLLLLPAATPRTGLPAPLEVAGYRFDVVEDLQAYTTLDRGELEKLLDRHVDNFRVEWHTLEPRPRNETWYYLTSRTYLFANANHFHTAPDVLHDVLGTSPPGSAVLDYGAGTGNLTLALAAAGFAVDYLELSALQKDFVRFRTQRYGLQSQIRILDWWQALEPARYDLICAFDVLEHLPDLRRVLEERLLPALAEGGRLVESSPFVRDLSQPMHHEDPGLEAILTAAGIRLVEARREYRVWQRDGRPSGERGGREAAMQPR